MNLFKIEPTTPKEKGDTIEMLALLEVMEQAMEKTKMDICRDCLDRRCESGRECKEFLRRSKSYAWEIVAKNAELN